MHGDLVLLRGASKESEFPRDQADDRYLGGFPEAIHLNFFAAVDKWLVEYIQTRSSGKDGLDSLPVALLHLVLAEPRFIDHPGIRPIIDRTRDKGKLAVLGLSPLLIRLAARDATWSMEACKLKPASTRTWSDEGVGAEVQALYTGQPNEREWSVITAILRTGALSAETLQQGLLDGRLDTGGGKPAKGLMSVLGSRLSGSSPGEYSEITAHDRIRKHLCMLFYLTLHLPRQYAMVIRQIA